MKKKVITAVLVIVVLAAVILAFLYCVGDKMLDSIFESQIEAQLNEEKPSTEESSKEKQNTEETKTERPGIENTNPEDNEKAAIDGEAANNSSDDQAGKAENIGKGSSVSTSGKENDTASDSVKKAGNGKNADVSTSYASGSTKDRNNSKSAYGEGTKKLDNGDKSSEAEPIEGQTEPQQAGAENKNEQELVAKTHYTAEDLKEVKNSVTAADKISVAAMLLKKLSASDINELKNMLPGGVSAAEKQRAKEIAYQRFDEDEIKVIIDIYMKYVYG